MANYRREGGDLRCDRSKIQSTYPHKLGSEGQPAAVCRLRAEEDALEEGSKVRNWFTISANTETLSTV